MMTKNNVTNPQDILNLMLANTNQQQIQRLAFVNSLSNADFPLEDILVYEDDLLSFAKNNLYKDNVTKVYTFEKEIAEKLNTLGTSKVLRDKSLLLIPSFFEHIERTHILSNEELNSIFDYAFIRVKSSVRELITPIKILIRDKVDIRKVINNFDETDGNYTSEQVEACKSIINLYDEFKYQFQLCVNTVTPDTVSVLKNYIKDSMYMLKCLFFTDRYNFIDVNIHRLIKDFTADNLANLIEFVQIISKHGISFNFRKDVSLNDLCGCTLRLKTLTSQEKYKIIVNDLLKALANTITSNYDLEMKDVVTLVLNDTPDKVWEFLISGMNKYSVQ